MSRFDNIYLSIIDVFLIVTKNKFFSKIVFIYLFNNYITIVSSNNLFNIYIAFTTFITLFNIITKRDNST